MVYVCILWREHPKAQPKVVLDKLGIDLATPGLQGIALIQYTTAASNSDLHGWKIKIWKILNFRNSNFKVYLYNINKLKFQWNGQWSYENKSEKLL